MDQQNVQRYYHVECTNELLDGTIIIGISATFRRQYKIVSTLVSAGLSISYGESVSIYAEHRGDRCGIVTVVCRRPSNKVEVKQSHVRTSPARRFSRYGGWRLRAAPFADEGAVKGDPAPIELIHVTD